MKRTALIALFLVLGILFSGCKKDDLSNANFTYDHTVAGSQAILRDKLVATAEEWLGAKESDGSFKPIIDLYNNQESLPRGYAVQYDDQWCATFVSAVAIKAGLTEIIPTECSCEQQIELFKELDSWVEDDAYLPLPGDIIYYRMDNEGSGDCTKWADHVGIVIGTYEGHIKVIEGNKDADVSYRILKQDDPIIRGFAVPDYAKAADTQ